MKNLLLKYIYNLGMEARNDRENNIISLINGQKNAAYLDCGCYDGRLTLRVAKKLQTKEIYGIEILPRAIRKAKKKGIKIYESNLNGKLPFMDNTFDVITAIEIIEHLVDSDMFMKELYRVCKKDGYVVIATENLAAWYNIFALVLGEQPSTGPWISNRYSIGFHPLAGVHSEKQGSALDTTGVKEDKHINVMTRNALKNFAQAYGFSVEREKPSGYYPFGGFLGKFLARIDRRHAVTTLFKLRKK